MSRPTNEYLWVNVTGGVMGFTPEQIIAFETEYATMKQYASYWDYFNHYFRDDLDGKAALGYSVLWYFEKPFKQLDRLRTMI